jgi:hypothetical protein
MSPVPPPSDLNEIRCRCCGGLVAYGRYSKPPTLFCSQACAVVPMSKTPDTELRDQVACELVLEGVSILQAARATGFESHQHLHQVLDRRGITTTIRKMIWDE